MRYLRQYIRKILREVYELDDEQLRRQYDLRRNQGWHYGSRLAKAAGLQSASGQIDDRHGLQQYQEMVKDSRDGKKMIDAFMQGKVTILHSFDFQGATSRFGMGGTTSKKLASEWIQSYGKKGKDALSVVAFFEPPTSSIATRVPLNNNAMFIASAQGVILKGYPVFVGEHDSFTQTLGAIDDKMKAHWKNSGIPKRPSEEKDDTGAFMGVTNLKRLKRLGYSNETILDNWTVVGTYISYANKSDGDIRKFVADSLSIGLPCNVYDPKGKLLERHEP